MRQIVLSSVLFVLVGCSVTQPIDVPERHKYTLTRVSQLSFPRSSKDSLFVSPVSSGAGYGTSGMIYVKRPYELRTFSNSSWASSPADILQDLLVESLQNAKLFQAIVSPPHSAFSVYRLDTKILVFQQEFVTKPSRVRLVVKFGLIQNKQHRLINQRRFHILIPAKRDDPYGGVEAANRAVHVLQEKLVHWLAVNLPSELHDRD